MKSLLLLALLSPAWLGAVAAPTGLTVTAIQSDQSATLSWNNDPVAQQWYIYLDGALVYQPFVANTTLNGSQRQFIMNALPYRSPITVNMKALAPPNPISGFSSSVSTYAQPVAPIPVSCVAGCLSGTVSVSLSGTVAVTQGGPLTVSGAVAVTSLPGAYLGVTCVSGCSSSVAFQGVSIETSVGLGVSVLAGVAGISVTASQGGPFTVSGSVGVSSFPGAYLGVTCVSGCSSSVAFQGVSIETSVGLPVSVIAGVAGISVTASQGGPFTVSGSVSVTNFPTAAQAVSVIAGVAGISVTASQGSPFTVSGSVSVTNFPTSAQAVSVIAGVAGISVTASQGSPFTVSGSVSVTNFPTSAQAVSVIAGAAGISVTASQGSPFTVSGSVSVTNFPTSAQAVSVIAGVAGISVTASQGGPFTVSGSVSVTNFPTSGQAVSIIASVGLAVTNLAGTAYIGAVGLSNSVGIAVSVTSGVAGISVTASQGSPFTVSGSVSVTNFPTSAQAVSVIASVGLAVTNLAGTAYIGAVGITNSVGIAVSVTSGVAGISVTASQGGPFTVSGSVSTAGNVSINAGTSIIGALVANQSVNLNQVGGAAVLVGNGATGTGSPRVTISSDNAFLGTTPTGNVASGATDSGNPLKIAGIVNTTLPTFTAGQRANVQQSVNGEVFVADYAPSRHTKNSAATTNATSVKASAGYIVRLNVTNINGAARWLKFYDKASAPTVGTDTPILTIAIPANGGYVSPNSFLSFATGIAYAMTANATDADNTAIAANDLKLVMDYK